MKKQLILMLSLFLLIAFSVPAFAAPWAGRGDAPWAYNKELTDEQKAEIQTMNQRLLEERKQMINNRVEWGYISREEADKRIAYLEERLQQNPYRPMFGNRGGMGYGYWAQRELTDEQKAEIQTMNQRLLAERKQMLSNRVEWGYISREKADKYIAFLEERLEKYPYLPLSGKGGHGGKHGWSGRHGGGFGWGW